MDLVLGAAEDPLRRTDTRRGRYRDGGEQDRQAQRCGAKDPTRPVHVARCAAKDAAKDAARNAARNGGSWGREPLHVRGTLSARHEDVELISGL